MVASAPARRETGRDKSDEIGGARTTSASIDARDVRIGGEDDPRAVSDDARHSRSRNRKEAGAEYDFLEIAKAAEDRDQTFKGAMQRARWQRAIAQLQNKHFGESKYNS